MRHLRANYQANRSRVRRRMPRDIAAELIHALDLTVEERQLVLALSAQWVSANDILASAAGPRDTIGELLVKSGRLTRQELDKALADQRESGQRLGEVMVRHGTMSAAEVRSVLAFQQRLGNARTGNPGPLQLGNLLVATGVITSAQLDRALEQQRQSKRRLGDALICAGYATKHQVAQGLRLQQTLLRIALAVLLALSSSQTAVDAAGGTAHGNIMFSATVLPYLRVDVLRQAPTLTVTPADVSRGFVDVPSGTALRAISNDRQGFTVSFDPRLRVFERVRIMGLDGNVEIGPEGGAARHTYSGRDTSLELSYRFYLAAGVAPGSYPWPLQISSSITY